MKLFKRNKRLLALEDYLGIFYVTDKWGDQEYKTEKDSYGTIPRLEERVKELEKKIDELTKGKK
ncbi:MAG: hypothetical protein WAT31_01990 [Candidatus Saccharimonas aalborgensis]|jgi:hypothetical protein